MGDCDEGCSDDCRHKWQIEPHPYSNDFDVFVTDDDAEALKVLQEAAEQAWDQCGDGMSRTITIRRRPAQETKSAPDNSGLCPVCGWPTGHCNVGCTAGASR